MNAGGSISSIKLKFNKTVSNIRSQELINCAVERSEHTDDATLMKECLSLPRHFLTLIINHITIKMIKTYLT